MTEAMSRHEIEDVLSSIRRLVTHEERPAQPKPASPGKLVLTSALRVDGGAGTSATPTAADNATPPAPSSGAQQANAPQPGIVSQHGHPSFADAPMRAPLLTRIAQAGRDAAQVQMQTAPAPMAEAPLPESESQLETTLARLEEALAIAPTKAPDPAETVIDEDALAEMVARIVRQELQGELGERITRNIRKLVRAEVARELQMRNL
ncbi:hypothetical protein [Roseibaca calidilacus]|uniref:Uncharacterized protein n=2 Tax=Roseibaca calidilacus TaxID=1666912 RepID=A0ABP2BZ01_9RHOB|nr:hypothetical protein [Roseibaca calidilacus]CUX82807.1 hypothetical protein Ga0058931_2595 [Roseibaca calidilacus]